MNGAAQTNRCNTDEISIGQALNDHFRFHISQPEARTSFNFRFDVSHQRPMQALLHIIVFRASWPLDDESVKWAMNFKGNCSKCYFCQSMPRFTHVVEFYKKILVQRLFEAIEELCAIQVIRTTSVTNVLSVHCKQLKYPYRLRLSIVEFSKLSV